MRKFLKVVALISSVFVGIITVFGQRDAIDFDRISIEEGLSQSTVYSIIQDHKGFLWFGTDDGLNRYDGYSFKVFMHIPGEESTISNNRVIALLEDSQNRLWVGTIGGGLNKYDWRTDQFIAYKNVPSNPNSLSNDRIMAICEDPSGKIWVGTADGGLNLFDPDTEIGRAHV